MSRSDRSSFLSVALSSGSLSLTGSILVAATGISTPVAAAQTAVNPFDVANPIVVGMDTVGGSTVRDDFPQALDLRWQDYDSDGYMDMLVWSTAPVGWCTPSSGGEMVIYYNRPDGQQRKFVQDTNLDPLSLVRQNRPSLLTGYYDIIQVDVDGDQDLDLVTAGNNTHERIFIFDTPSQKYVAVYALHPGGAESEYWKCWTNGACPQPNIPACMNVYPSNCNAVQTDAGEGICKDILLDDDPARVGCLHDCELTGDCAPCGIRRAQGVYKAHFTPDHFYDLVFAYRGSRPTVYINIYGNAGTQVPVHTGTNADNLNFANLGEPPGRISIFRESTRLPAPVDEPLVCDPLQENGVGLPVVDPFNPFPGSIGRDVKTGDLDKDGNVDVIVMRRATNGACGSSKTSNTCLLSAYVTPVVYRNAGLDPVTQNPVFYVWYELLGPEGDPCIKNQGQSLEVADLDGDGFLDIIVPVDEAGQDRRPRIYLNDGGGQCGDGPFRINPACNASGAYGVYTVPSQLLGSNPNGRYVFVDVKDLNCDGLNDMVVASHNIGGYAGTDEIWLMSAPPVPGQDLQFDLASPAFPHACLPSSEQAGNCMTCNFAKGDDTRYVRLQDIDNDGDCDYAEANFKGDFQRVYLNQSASESTSCTCEE